MSRPAALRRLSVRLFFAAAALFALALWQERRLPAPRALLPELQRAPEQGPTDRAPFEFAYKGKRCFVKPVASYELWGLVVSRNDIHSVSDIYHDATSIDTRDLCVVWGRNAASGSYRKAEIWSGPFTCYWRTPEGLDFDPTTISNNHLLTDRPELRRELMRVHLGDQVHLKGLLVDYQMEDWDDFWRRTSTVRTDSGCEVLFFERLDVLRANAPSWHALSRLTGALLVLLPLVWLGLFVFEARRGSVGLGEL